MKLLLDQGLPRSTVLELQKLSIDSIHVGEIGMASYTDSDIISKALTDCKVKGFLITILADEERGEMGYVEITDKHKAKYTAMEELKSYSIPAN